jgi:hypothetical protein
LPTAFLLFGALRTLKVSETAGLKRPPETPKKIQALTAREKPRERAM